MIKSCEEFGKEYGVEYNPTTTVCIRFSKKDGPTPGPGFQVELETRFAAQAQKP